MTKKQRLYKTLIVLLMCFTIFSCKKQLDAKPDKHLQTPSTLADLQALLDYSTNMYVEPAADESATDNYYVTDASYNAFTIPGYRSIYTWEKGGLFEGPNSDWGIAYRKVYYCNTVLEVLPLIVQKDIAEWKNIKGQALFKRAKTFWHIVNTWSLAYDSSTAATNLGIPLRLNTYFEETSVRSSVKKSFEQIIIDLEQAVQLLPVIPLHPIRPSKPAAYAMLSRVYLSMRQYNNAKLYADSALALFGSLLDYNTVNAVPAFPFANPNAETILVSVSSNSLLSPSNAKIDSLLFSMYEPNDLRKNLFFKSLGNNQYSYRGSYSNSNGLFSGLSTSELYLTRAECYARVGNIPEALADLNALLIKRYKSGLFIPVTAGSAQDALSKILVERRKELLMRFTRWMDIKRLNKEGAGIILKRFILGQTYLLPPDDLRYAMALPEDIIAISGMPQNPR